MAVNNIPYRPYAANPATPLPERILTGNSVPLLRLKAIDVIGQRGSGDATTLKLLALTLAKDTRQLTPLQRLDENFIRLESSRVLESLAVKPAGGMVRKLIPALTRLVLSRPDEDVKLKVEMISAVQRLGLDKQDGVLARHIEAEIQGNLEISSMLARYPGAQNFQNPSSSNFSRTV